ncbi:MAG: error-prone DNA polymerase, partial [Pseudomonadota bacterium]
MTTALQNTSNFDFLRGASHPEELVERAYELGYEAIAITDRNSLAGIIRAYGTAKKLGMGFITACRLDLSDAPSLLAYPTDREAYGRLCQLLSTGKLRAPKGECDLSLDDVCTHAEGMIFVALAPEDRDELTSAMLRNMAQQLAAPLYLGITRHHGGTDIAETQKLVDMARQLGLETVALGDALYHDPTRRPLQDVVTCIREGCQIEAAGYRLEANAERHLKSPAEMARLFAPWPQALRNVEIIAAQCAFSIDQLKYNYPEEPVPPGKTPQEHLEQLTWTGAAVRYPDGIPEKVQASIRKELALIEELNYPQYFLTVYDIVQWARSQGILCQGRGSSANSAVCYCLHITSVNPAEMDLLIERFISAARNEPPDIDVDFEHERREEVMQYIYGRYGRDRAGIAATVITYRGRSAVREVAKVMGLSEDVQTAMASTVWGSWGKSVDDQKVIEAGLDPRDRRIRMVLKLTEQLIGFPRHLSQHVGGFVLTQDRLVETVPIGNGAMADRTFIEWDKDDLATAGLMKIDVLALGMLTCIQKSLGLMRDHYGVEKELGDFFPANDAATFEMLQRADSLGVFQVESRAQMNMLPRLRPKEFYDLVIQVAIVRPGPIQGDMVHPYLRRRDGLEPVTFPSPGAEHGPPDELERILKRTLGVPIFQEQAMRIAIDAAKFTGDEANELRYAMATFRRRGTIEKLQAKMINRMIDRGYEPEFAERCFKQIKGFGEYGFPESHAASFSLLVYVSSWIKCHYPAVFCCALLNSQPMGFYAPAQIVRDAREHGVQMRPVDINHSDWDNTLEPCAESTG